jgi:hypothetical protein
MLVRRRSEAQSFHPFAVFDDHIHALQKVDVPQNIASQRDDIGELSCAN